LGLLPLYHRRVPHIPDFLWSFVGFPTLPAPFLKERRTRGPGRCCVQEIRGISLVFREMWDTEALAPRLFWKVRFLPANKSSMATISPLRSRDCRYPHATDNPPDRGR
jgi:hypothetical protein